MTLKLKNWSCAIWFFYSTSAKEEVVLDLVIQTTNVSTQANIATSRANSYLLNMQYIKTLFQFWFSTTSLCVENCIDDSQCKNEEVCYNGECIKCTNDNHCEEKERCYKHSCLPSCKVNGDCGNGKYCHIDHKVCLSICKTDKNCESGYQCKNGQCFQSCSEDNPCLANDQYCHK